MSPRRKEIRGEHQTNLNNSIRGKSKFICPSCYASYEFTESNLEKDPPRCYYCGQILIRKNKRW